MCNAQLGIFKNHFAVHDGQEALGGGQRFARSGEHVLRQQGEIGSQALALRFKEKGGQSPLDYLTRWRMFRAGHLLRNRDKALVEIASSVGYDSEAAFNKAFKRTTGSAPGAYRRSMQNAAAAHV